jgi:hypothetical protein
MGTNLGIYSLKKDGTEFRADISLSPLMTDVELLIIASIRDITERKLAELQIERNYLIQTAISAVLKVSLEPTSLDEQLNKALDLILAVPGVFPQATGAIYLVEDEPEVLVLRAPSTFSASQIAPCERVAFGECICGKAGSTCTVAFTECLDARHEIPICYLFPRSHSATQLIGS